MDMRRDGTMDVGRGGPLKRGVGHIDVMRGGLWMWGGEQGKGDRGRERKREKGKMKRGDGKGKGKGRMGKMREKWRGRRKGREVVGLEVKGKIGEGKWQRSEGRGGEEGWKGLKGREGKNNKGCKGEGKSGDGEGEWRREWERDGEENRGRG